MKKITNKQVVEIVQEMVDGLSKRIEALEQKKVSIIKENVLDTAILTGTFKHYNLSVDNQKLFLNEIGSLMKNYKVVSLNLILKK